MILVSQLDRSMNKEPEETWGPCLLLGCLQLMSHMLVSGKSRSYIRVPLMLLSHLTRAWLRANTVHYKYRSLSQGRVLLFLCHYHRRVSVNVYLSNLLRLFS